MPEKTPEPYKIDDLIKQSKVPVVASNPTPKAESPAKDGMFLGKDGRKLWRYEIDGETHILPKPIEQMTEEDYYRLGPSFSDSVVGRLPQNLSVTFRDPQWAGYWFNKSANKGVRVSEARAMGFVPAKREDVDKIVAGLEETDSSIEQHDLVLMKIHKAKLYSRYAQLLNTARKQGGIDSYKNNAEAFVQQAGGDLDKGQYYLTAQAKQEFQGVGPVVNLPTVATT